MSDYRWLNEFSQKFLEKDYLLPGQTVDERVTLICENAERILGKPGFAEKFKENIKKGWYSLSTPVWTNFGSERALPISCYGTMVGDSMESILDAQAEVGMFSKQGGGTSVYLGKLRERGAAIKNNGTSSGSVHFAQLFESEVNVISQGSTRRGSCAVYQDLDHPDIEEFLTIRSEGHPIQSLSFGVCVSDAFMEGMIARDPRRMKIWAKVLESRINKGYPYIFFSGNANKYAPQVYKDLGMVITHTNLCTEIMECDTEDESFVCDLGSMNLLYYDEWKNTDAVELYIYFLDAVMSEYIEKASKIKYMERAVRFATRQRALGLGVLGWHSYLQSKMIPYESMAAKLLNVEIFKNISKNALLSSAKLAQEYGEPELLKGRGVRNVVRMAIAPTKSSAFILEQVSENTELFLDNYHVEDLAKIKFTFKNPYLKKLLAEKGKDTKKTWLSIADNGGSVQHLDFLSDEEKAVFKTFAEVSPREVIIQAAARQRYIDQGQSLNLHIDKNAPIKDINALYIEAWQMGIKSLYYQYGVNAAQRFTKNILSCSSCEA